MWEVTAGGSALKGENPLMGAIRELKEETMLNICVLQIVRRIPLFCKKVKQLITNG